MASPPLVRAERHGGGGDVGRNIWRLASYRTRTLKKTVFCPGSITPFVPVLEPGFAFRDKRLEAFVPGGRTGTKCPTR